MRYPRRPRSLSTSAPRPRMSTPHSFPTTQVRRFCPSHNLSLLPKVAFRFDGIADRQTWVGRVATLYGVSEFHYRDYVLRADKIVYNQATTELQAEGHVQVTGGPEDAFIEATHGDMRIDMHTARFYKRHRLHRSSPQRPHRRLFHYKSLSLYRQGADSDRRGQLPRCRRAP